jgi:beta-glucosidase
MIKKLRMSNLKLRRILIPVLVLVVSLIITVNVGVYFHPSSLDILFGKGQRTVTLLDKTAQLDTNYYPQLYYSTKSSREAAIQLSKHISDEGIVLLKNDGLLPLSESETVSPFGLRYVLPFYGGRGSGAIDTSEAYIVTPQEGLHNAFRSVNTSIEERLFQTRVSDADLGTSLYVTASTPLGAADIPSATLYEFDTSLYGGLESSCAGTVGIVFLGRQAGENSDSFTGPYADATPHMLALTAAERATIAYAKAHCRAVAVVLESSVPMQLAELEDDDKIAAILWVGGPGSTGYQSLGDILAGTVIPSGRTADIFPVDFRSDPTFPNHDDGTYRFVYQNAYTSMAYRSERIEEANAPFREYEEGLYLGYKYYETSCDIGYISDYYNRLNGVVYPFGYGLSYTQFSQELLFFSDYGDRITMTVRVKNVGAAYTGKDVVQVYFTAPYTSLDQQYDIEKPTAVLVAFEKTELLSPGEYEDVRISFSKEDMASYCYTRRNDDGTRGCYMLEAGEYRISIRRNSHEIWDTRKTEQPATIWYDGHNPRQTEVEAQSALDRRGVSLGYPVKKAIGQSTYLAATNQFEQMNLYMSNPSYSGAVSLSRKDWAGTQPTAPTALDQRASDEVIRWISSADSIRYDYQTDTRLGNGPQSMLYQEDRPVTGAKNGIVLADLRGRSYYDPLWMLLLAQLDFSNPEHIRQALFENAYHTGRLDAIGKPESVEQDGPQGLTQPDQLGRNWLDGACGYPSAPVMAAAWNKALMYDFGYMVGQEALTLGISGWYAPALNTHRSPFSGRAAEYFSEDGVLSGYLGAQILSGGGDAGIYCSVKHFALMESEHHRNPHTANWLTEQALREVYLKPFELALKTARKTIRFLSDKTGSVMTRTMRAGDFIMTADGAVGADWAGTSYDLLTAVVRGEWGFQGFIISDMSLNSNDNRVDKMLRSGCDSLMSASYGEKANARDFSSAVGLAQLRHAIKNICYTIVNSNLTQGAAPGSTIHYSLAPWQRGLYAANITAGLLLIAAAGWLLWRGYDERRNPDRYFD